MSAESRVATLEQQIARMQATLDRLPLYLPPPPEVIIVKIIGGNLLNGVQQIAYVADPITVTTLYDPDVDTSYVDGLGNAWAFDRYGRQLRRVLLRHNFGGYADPLPIDRTFLATGGTTLTVSGGPNNGKTMPAYTLLRG